MVQAFHKAPHQDEPPPAFSASCLQGARAQGPFLRSGPPLSMDTRQFQDLPPALPSWGLSLPPKALSREAPSPVTNICSHSRPCSRISTRPCLLSLLRS